MYSYQHEVLDGYVLVRSFGEFELDEAIAGIRSTLGLLRETGLAKVLYDNSKMLRGLFATEKTLFASELVVALEEHHAAGGQALEFATLTAHISTYQPFVEVLNSAGVAARTFDDLELAMQWLKLDGAALNEARQALGSSA